MSTQIPQGDPWRWPALVLWTCFFLFGLWPEQTYYTLRAAGYVFSQNAVINSYHFITWCLTGFLMHFVYHRCREAKLPGVESLGKATQLGVLAFVAFVDIPVAQIGDVRDTTVVVLVAGTALFKLSAWLYLYTLLLRYYLRLDPAVIGGALSWLAPHTHGDGDGRGEPARDKAADPRGHGRSMKEQAD